MGIELEGHPSLAHWPRGFGIMLMVPCVDFSIVVREEVQEGTLLRTAEERVSQYLWQRPDLQPVDVAALTPERLPEDIERQLPPEHIPPRRSL